MNQHQNNGNCLHCREISETFPGIDQKLLTWFILMQAKFPNFHIAEAGRGKVLQEDYFTHKPQLSRAKWTQSAHNWNAAIDTFFVVDGKYSLAPELYAQIIPEMPDFIVWYGAPGAKFPERPHFEIKNWEELATQGYIHLVE